MKVKHLLIISGPSAVGKTTLIDDLINKQSKISHRLLKHTPEQLENATICNAINVEKLEHPNIDFLILHYDIYSNFKEGEGFLYLPDLFRSTESIRIITLVTHHRVLVKRTKQRFVYYLFRALIKPSPSKFKKLRLIYSKIKTYQSPTVANAIYERWENFLSEWDVRDHQIIDTTTDSLATTYDSTTARSVLTGVN
ncbi:MAG: hypothetical protein ABJF11_02870 [Reichenbachiella sp.]|uniref:hypothetical protein n=1 Tax=Reichenbachiella sp. TaxID=2184521 RepID=UPI00326393A6